jgi:Protein of unknown function (DUF2914)
MVGMKRLKHWYQEFKHHWLTISFVAGFLNDFFLLNRVDSLMDHLILLAYITIGAASLILFYVGVAGRGGERFAAWLREYMPGVMQYTFGGIFSGMLIFYGRSGDWITSAPFLLLIISVVLGNELVHKRSDRLVYHISIFFIGLFSYIVLLLPIVFGVMGDAMFFFSGVVSLLLITILAQILYRVIPNFMRANTQRIILVIGAIYTTFNVLYFTAVLPPIPLSLNKLETVHSVTKTDGGYQVVTESQPWWRELPFMRPILHVNDDTLSCFARVYAPAKLTTEIYHRWEYKDGAGNWVQKGRIPYPIAGTNKGGYRGYTTISGVQSGTWRCSVETKRGQVLGRSTVIVQTGGSSQNFVTQTE